MKAIRCKSCGEVSIVPKTTDKCPHCDATLKLKSKSTATDGECTCHCPTCEQARATIGSVIPVAGPDVTPDSLSRRSSELIAGRGSEMARSRLTRDDLRWPGGNRPGQAFVDSGGNYDPVSEFLTINEESQQLYNMVYGFLSKNNELIKGKTLSSSALCDFGFFSRELAKLFDELRKELVARQDLCGQIIAYRKTQESLTDPDTELNVSGQFATGSPNVKMVAALPKKFTDEYFQLTDYFQIPRGIAQEGVVRLDWNATIEFVTKCMNEGKSVPEGFGKKYPIYTTTYRKKK